MADQGADANFISASFLEEIKNYLPSWQMEELSLSLIFPSVTEDPCIMCAQSIFLDVFLQIRHGTSLIPRNINWKLTDEDLKTPIIARNVLESLGCDNRDMLLAAPNMMRDDINVSEKLNQNGNKEEH